MSLTIETADKALADVKLRALAIAPPGAGKTHFSSTCPKVYYIGMSRGESDTFATRPDLKKNIVKVAILVPDGNEELKKLFGDLDKGLENGVIHQAIQEAKDMYAKGEVETLVIDTVTYLVDYLWQYINIFCKKLNAGGELDTRGMYGDLQTKLLRLIGLRIISFPGNLIVTSHEQLESDEALAKKPDKSNPVVASILGGFRNKIEGMFSIVMYLSKLEQGGEYTYWARLNKGNARNAKSRLPLPDKIQNISYTTIMNEIKKVSSGQAKTT